MDTQGSAYGMHTVRRAALQNHAPQRPRMFHPPPQGLPTTLATPSHALCTCKPSTSRAKAPQWTDVPGARTGAEQIQGRSAQKEAQQLNPMPTAQDLSHAPQVVLTSRHSDPGT